MEKDEKKCKLNIGSYLEINMMSPERLLELSYGEVTVADTINCRYLKPSKDGLFCEKIFGPEKDYECRCGKYKKKRYMGVVCNRCGVEVTSTSVRRERHGHIELGCDIVYPQYFYGNPSILATVLDMPQQNLEDVIFLDQRIDTEEYWDYDNKLSSIVNDEEWYRCKYTGIDAIKRLLEKIDISKEIKKLNNKLEETYGYIAQPLLHRKEVLEAFQKSNNSPEWMITSRILVLPAGLRPIIQLDDKIYSSEINERYLTVIRRSILLYKMYNMRAPRMLINAQKRMIQFAVDALFDKKLDRAIYDDNSKLSLIDRRKKKIDRYIDYSAEGEMLKDYEIDIDCIGMPYEIIKVVFRPFIIRELVQGGYARNEKHAMKLIDIDYPTVKEAISYIEDELVVLVVTANGRMALRVKLSQNKKFGVHPIVYSVLGCDSGNDNRIQIFALISEESKKEAVDKLGVRAQIISPISNKLQIMPDRYAIKWIAKLSKIVEDNGRRLISPGEAYCAYSNKSLKVNEKIYITCHTKNGFVYEEQTSLGRLIINEFLPQNMGKINRKNFKNKYLLEYNCEMSVEDVYSILLDVYNQLGADKYLDVLQKFEKVYEQYIYAIEIECEENIGNAYKNNGVNSVEFDLLKQLSRNIHISNIESGYKKVHLNYANLQDIHFYKEYLAGRVLAKDIYCFADIIAHEGTYLTTNLIKKIFEEKIEDVFIYDAQINSKGEYAEKSFGVLTGKNPFKLAALAIMETVNKLTDKKAKNLITILFEKDNIYANEEIEEILFELKQSDVYAVIKDIWDEEENLIYISKLNIEEYIYVKTRLLYEVLKNEKQGISIKLLDIVVKMLCVKMDVEYNQEYVVIPNENSTLSLFGEYAVKNINLYQNNTELKSYFGIIKTPDVINEEIVTYKGIAEEEEYAEYDELDDDFVIAVDDDDDYFYDDDYFE